MEANSFINSKGVEYFLHTKDVTLANSNGIQTIYFFSKVADNAINLPDGYSIVENQRSGLLFLKKQR